MFNTQTLNLVNKLYPKFISDQLGFLNNLYIKKTLPSSLQKKLLEALASICLILSGIEPETVAHIVKIKPESRQKNIELLRTIILKSKELGSLEAYPTVNIEFLNNLYVENCNEPNLTPSEKAELAVSYLVKKEDFDILNEVEPKRTERLKQIKKLTEE